MSLTSALSFGVDVCLVSAVKGEAQESQSLKREGESAACSCCLSVAAFYSNVSQAYDQHSPPPRDRRRGHVGCNGAPAAAWRSAMYSALWGHLRF